MQKEAVEGIQFPFFSRKPHHKSLLTFNFESKILAKMASF